MWYITRNFQIAQGDQKSQRTMREDMGSTGAVCAWDSGPLTACATAVRTRCLRQAQLRANVEGRGKRQNKTTLSKKMGISRHPRAPPLLPFGSSTQLVPWKRGGAVEAPGLLCMELE